MLFKISVPDMHCEHCAARINKALDGVEIKHEIDLNAKLVIIDGCEHCFNMAMTEIEDLGFTPEKI